MPHLDPDRLTLIALGETAPSGEETEHLSGCQTCGDDLETLSGVVRVGRESDEVRDLPSPPDSVWAAIAAEAFTEPAPAGTALAPGRPTEPGPVGIPRPRRWQLALAAAVVAVLAIAGTLGVQAAGNRRGQQVVAEVDLTPQPGAPRTAHGIATVTRTDRGLQMSVDLTGMPATTGYYAVWLYDGSQIMIPIGSPGAAPLNIPATASDISKFPLVDVSVQELGQQSHGVSMLQGRLTL